MCEKKYFVLNPKGNSVVAEASRVAMRAYAKVLVRYKVNLEIAKILQQWTHAEEVEAAPVSIGDLFKETVFPKLVRFRKDTNAHFHPGVEAAVKRDALIRNMYAPQYKR